MLSLVVSADTEVENNFMTAFHEMSHKYEWVDSQNFLPIYNNSILNDLDYRYVCALITAESNGKNVISRKNRNGTRDVGLMQVNCFTDEEILKYKDLNAGIKEGTVRLKKAVEKSAGNLAEATRLYNQGINGKKEFYRNTAYVKRVMLYYTGYQNE